MRVRWPDLFGKLGAMWWFIGIVVVLALIGLFALISPGSPGREMRNRRDAQAGWRGGGQVSWFHDDDRSE